MVAANVPPGDSPRSKIMTPSWFTTFNLKICFLNYSVAFKGFRKGFLWKHFVKSLNSVYSNKRKIKFFGLWRWKVTLSCKDLGKCYYHCCLSLHAVAVTYHLCLHYHFIPVIESTTSNLVFKYFFPVYEAISPRRG